MRVKIFASKIIETYAKIMKYQTLFRIMHVISIKYRFISFYSANLISGSPEKNITRLIFHLPET